MAIAPPQPGWGDVIREYAATELTARRLTEQLRACEAAALAFCRLLERWHRGEAVPATAGRARRRSGMRPIVSRRRLPGWKPRCPATCSSSSRSAPRAARGTAGPGRGARRVAPVLDRAGVHACPNRVAAVYLELAVLVRALEGLADAARLDSAPDRSSLWAGLFDLRDTLLGSTVDDLRALAA